MSKSGNECPQGPASLSFEQLQLVSGGGGPRARRASLGEEGGGGGPVSPFFQTSAKLGTTPRGGQGGVRKVVAWICVNHTAPLRPGSIIIIYYLSYCRPAGCVTGCRPAPPPAPAGSMSALGRAPRCEGSAGRGRRLLRRGEASRAMMDTLESQPLVEGSSERW